MLTYNFRVLMAPTIAGQPSNSNTWYYTRGWSGRYGYSVTTTYWWLYSIGIGFNNNNENRGPFDYSTESDFIASNKSYYGGNRLNNYNSTTISGAMLILGSGTTPPTKGDYKLESWIPTSKLRYVSSVHNANTNKDKIYIPEYTYQLSYTYQNISADPITVGEIGLVQFQHLDTSANGGTSNETTKLLLARNVLDDPITIQPGELYTFTMVLK